MYKRKLKMPAEGQPIPPLTRLKGMSEGEQDAVMAVLQTHSYEKAEPLVEKLVGFACSKDTLGRFHRWHKGGQLMAWTQETLSGVTGFLKERHPDWSEEQMRESASAYFMAQTVEKEDARSFACVAQLGLKSRRSRFDTEKLDFEKVKLDRRLEMSAKRLEFDREKFEWSRREQLDIALKALGDGFRENPEALAHFRKASEALCGKVSSAGCQVSGEDSPGSSETNDEGSPNAEGDGSAEHLKSESETEEEGWWGRKTYAVPVRSKMVLSMKCGCVCETCNAGKELSSEEIAARGKACMLNGTLVYSGKCHCFCARCAERKEASGAGPRFGGESLSNAERGVQNAELQKNDEGRNPKSESSPHPGPLPSDGRGGSCSSVESKTQSELDVASLDILVQNSKSAPSVPKVRKTAVFRPCRCFCTECNAKSGLTIEEAGATSMTASHEVDIWGCRCACERCQELEKEVWRKRFARYEELKAGMMEKLNAELAMGQPNPNENEDQGRCNDEGRPPSPSYGATRNPKAERSPNSENIEPSQHRIEAEEVAAVQSSILNCT